MRKILMLGAVALMTATGGVVAQEVTFGGQVRPRFEFRSLDGFDADVGTHFTSMRTRVWLRAGLPSSVTAFVQLQDVRVWGEETSTTDPVANALDLHQGWLEFGDPVEGGHALRLGRQELAYGEERLVGALDWFQQARSFDGLRFRARPHDRPVVVDGFAMRIAEDDVFARDAGFYGVYGTSGPYDVYALFNTFAESVDGADDGTGQVTLGGRAAGDAGVADWRVELAYQLGSRLGQDVAAYLLALRAGMPFGDGARAELWYDRLSGDDDPLDDEARVFDTLFATNHKFYGLMDLFTNIPLHTGGRGLQDLAVKTMVPVRERGAAMADLHGFWVTAGDGLASTHLGIELDLTGRWSYAPGVGLSGGLGLFKGGDAWATNDLQTWLFAMVDVTF